MIRGLDVSNHQGSIDWESVSRAGYAFAFAKATEGTGYTDPSFVTNWQEIRAAGMIRGAYHYARPDLPETAEEQARYFVDRLGELFTGDLLALDVEVGDGDLLDWCGRFLRQVHLMTRVTPLVYSSPTFIAAHNLAFFSKSSIDPGLWLAAWQDADPVPPTGWTLYAIWQQSSTGQVPGIVGPVDIDFFNGSILRLPLYGAK